MSGDRMQGGARTFGEESQLLVPESFIALHTLPSGRLALTKQDLLEGYELCEDMANALTEQCSVIHFRDGVDEAEVLRRCLAGLIVEPAVLSAPQAKWVIQRTAELLGWPFNPPAP